MTIAMTKNMRMLERKKNFHFIFSFLAFLIIFFKTLDNFRFMLLSFYAMPGVMMIMTA